MGAFPVLGTIPTPIRSLGEKTDSETQRWLTLLDPVFTLVDAARTETESRRRSPDRVHDALASSGLTRMWISPGLGGAGVSLRTGIHILTQLATHDASVSWQMGVQGAIGRLSDYLPVGVAHEIFATHTRLVIGSVNPTGRAVRTDAGDYRLTGRWSLASGSPHAAWFVAAARVVDAAGLAVPNHHGGAEIVHLFVPRAAVTLGDTWYSLGLRGSASADFTIEEELVPAERAVEGDALLRPPPERDGLGYRIAYHDFGPFTSAATALGIATDALATLKRLAREKTPSGGASSLAGSGVIQDRIARAEALVLFSRIGLDHAAVEVTAHGESGGADLSALVRLTAATVAENARTVVGIATEVSGASSIYVGSRIERSLRDIHTATKHITLSASHLELVGQYLLGGPLLVRK